MNKLLVLLALTLPCFAQQKFERVIKDENHTTTVKLNLDTVRCSAIGYEGSELKVTLPSLKWEAIFDHDNGEGLGPCITAGRKSCIGKDILVGRIPPDFLNEEKPEEKIYVRVILTEEFYVNRDDVCTRTLRENVVTNIRGIDFTHVRIKDIGELPLEKCLSQVN